MINTMFACLTSKLSDLKEAKVSDVNEAEPLIKDTKAIIYRDELNPPPSKAVVKKNVRFVDSEHVIKGNEKDCIKGSNLIGIDQLGGGVGGSERIRVKVKMTREEAARFLSKCKEGGVLELKDVARELAELPLERVSVLS